MRNAVPIDIRANCRRCSCNYACCPIRSLSDNHRYKTTHPLLHSPCLLSSAPFSTVGSTDLGRQISPPSFSSRFSVFALDHGGEACDSLLLRFVCDGARGSPRERCLRPEQQHGKASSLPPGCSEEREGSQAALRMLRCSEAFQRQQGCGGLPVPEHARSAEAGQNGRHSHRHCDPCQVRHSSHCQSQMQRNPCSAALKDGSQECDR